MIYADLGIDMSSPSTLDEAFNDPGLNWTTENLKRLCLALSARIKYLEEECDIWHDAYSNELYEDRID